MLVFVVFPLLYTVQIGFTNYSSDHLLSQARARAYLLDQTVADEAHAWAYTLHADGTALRLRLSPLEGSGGPVLVTPPLALDGGAAPVPLQPLGDTALGAPLSLRDRLRHRDGLLQLQLQLPAAQGGGVIRYAGVREFGPIEPLWQANADGSITQRASGTVYRADRKTGFFENAAGDRMQPGFKVDIGLANYSAHAARPGLPRPLRQHLRLDGGLRRAHRAVRHRAGHDAGRAARLGRR